MYYYYPNILVKLKKIINYKYNSKLLWLTSRVVHKKLHYFSTGTPLYHTLEWIEICHNFEITQCLKLVFIRIKPSQCTFYTSQYIRNSCFSQLSQSICLSFPTYCNVTFKQIPYFTMCTRANQIFQNCSIYMNVAQPLF